MSMRAITGVFFWIATVAPAPAARNFVRASSQFIRAESVSISAAPLTISAWYRPSVTNAQQVIIHVNNTGSSNTQGHYLILRTAGPSLGADTASTVGTGESLSAATFTAGQWHHIGGIWSSSTSRVAWLNGTAATPNTSSADPGTLTRVDIGRLANASNYTDGDLAEVAVWSAALTDAEMLALAAGVPPLLVRPQSLVFYAPLVRDVLDVRGGASLTTSGPTPADHPRTYRPAE